MKQVKAPAVADDKLLLRITGKLQKAGHTARRTQHLDCSKSTWVKINAVTVFWKQPDDRVTVSVRAGKIRMTDGDGTVRIYKKTWPVTKIVEAENWLLGYLAAKTGQGDEI